MVERHDPDVVSAEEVEEGVGGSGEDPGGFGGG